MSVVDPVADFSWKPLAVCCFIGGFLGFLAILYPGFLCYDSVNQIIEARDGVFSDWHPPLMAIIWRGVGRVAPGSAGMFVLQSSLVWLGLFLVYLAYFKRRAGVWAAPLLCLLLFLPPVAGIAGAIIKDVFMWGALLIAFGAGGFIGGAGQSAYWRWVWFLLSLLALWLAILFRHNAIFATLPMLMFIVHRMFRLHGLLGLLKAVFAGGLIGVVFFVGSGALNQRLADRHTRPWAASAVFDVAGVIVALPDEAEQRKSFSKLASSLNSTGTLEALLKNYSPIYWRGGFRRRPGSLQLPKDFVGPRVNGFSGLPAFDADILRELWLRSVSEHFEPWLDHRLAAARYLVGLAPDGAWSPFIMSKDFPLDLEKYFGPRPRPTALQAEIERLYENHRQAWLFQPWVYLLTGLMVFCWGLVRFRVVGAEVVCLAASGIFHEAGLVLAAPSPDYRYSHYMVFCALLGVLMLMRRQVGCGEVRTAS